MKILTKFQDISKGVSKIVLNVLIKRFKSKVVADDVIRNFKTRVLLAAFTLATCAYIQTCFRDFLESQIFLLINVASSND